MFNPFNYQGATATIDGQPASMNGHSRIPEFVTNGVATNPIGVGYGQTYGYATGIPSFNGTSIVNPMTGIPGTTTTTGIPATIPTYINNPFVNTINPFVNNIGGYPMNITGQPITPWGINAGYPVLPNIYNTIPATTFGIPAVQPFFGAGLTINPLTGMVQPIINTITNPFTGHVMPTIAPTGINPFITNPMLNAITTPTIPNTIGFGTPAVAVNPYITNPTTIYNTPAMTGVNVNPFVSGINTLAGIGALNAAACGCTTGIDAIHAGVTTPSNFNHLICRMAGVNPIVAQIAALAHNPLNTLNNVWANGINNVLGGMVNPMINPMTLTGWNNTIGGLSSPWNAYGINPINTLGHINPWMGGINHNWMTATNPLATIGHNVFGLANGIGGLGFGGNVFSGLTTPVTSGLINTIGGWPTRCI